MKPIKLHKNFIKKRDKLVNSNTLSIEKINETLDLFLEDPKNHKLRVHKIKCRIDKHRYSVTVLNTQYRILYSSYKEVNLLVYIASHDEYQRLNKNC